MRTFRGRFWIGLVWMASIASIPAQDQARGSTAGVDPYTRGESKRIERAGYTSIGKFDWAPGQTTEQIEGVLGKLPYCWIETEHFRICSTAPAYKLRDSNERKRIGRELKQLKKKLPLVKPRTKTLDRWLRAHLIAQRCEDLYADFAKRVGVTDDDFPARRPMRLIDREMGSGPYLGQPGKYLVMIFEKEASYVRYTERFLRERWDHSRRKQVGRDECMWFGTALELTTEMGETDDALQAHLVYNVVSNLVDGFKEFRHVTPTWLRYGIASWYVRDVLPDHSIFERSDLVEPDMRGVTDWHPRVFRLVKNGGATRIAELVGRVGCEQFQFRDYMLSWSLVDYLLTRRAKDFPAFLGRYKSPVDGYSSSRQVKAEELLRHQASAMEAALSYDAEALEAAWSKWVRKAYRKRRS